MSEWDSRTYLNDFSTSMLSWSLSWLCCSDRSLTSLSSSSEFDLLGLSFSVLVISNFASLVSSVLWWLIRNKVWTKIVHIDTADSSTSHDWHCTILLLNHLCAVFFVSNAYSILNGLILLLPECIHNLSSTSWTFMPLRHLFLNEICHIFTRVTWLTTSIGVIVDILRMGSISRFFRDDCWARSSWLWGSLLLKRNRPWFWRIWAWRSRLLLLLILNTTLIENDYAISNFRRFWWFVVILDLSLSSGLVRNVHWIHLLITVIWLLLLLLLLNTILDTSNIWIVSQMVNTWSLLVIRPKLLLSNRSIIFWVWLLLLRSIISSSGLLLTILRCSLLVCSLITRLICCLSIISTSRSISISVICSYILYESSNCLWIVNYEVVYVIVVYYICDCMTLLGIWLSATLSLSCRSWSLSLIIVVLLICLRLVLQEVVASLDKRLGRIGFSFVPHGFARFLFWRVVSLLILKDDHSFIFRAFLLFVFFARLFGVFSLSSNGLTSSSFPFATCDSDSVIWRAMLLFLNLLLYICNTGTALSIIFIDFKPWHDLFFIHLLLIFSSFTFLVKHFRSSRRSWSNILVINRLLALITSKSTIFQSLGGHFNTRNWISPWLGV